MTLRLVRAEFHDGLEDALLAWLSAIAEADPLVERWVVVPSNHIGIHLSREHARRSGGYANIRFMTLKDLARRAAGTPLPGGRTLVPGGGEELLLRRLLDGGLAKNGYFDAIADRPGLASALSGAIRDLKESRHTPDTLAAAASSAGIRALRREDKFGELLRIWRQYEINMEAGGWADDADLMEAAVERLEYSQDVQRLDPGTTAGAPRLPDCAAVYGFYDINGLQRALVTGLVRAVDSTVFFPFADIDDYEYARPALAWLRSLEPDAEVDASDSPPQTELPLPRETIIISAPGEAREAREDLRTLVAAARKDGTAFQDMAVIARSPDAYADVFRDQCSCIGLTPYLESPAPLSRTRLGKAVVHLVEAVRADLPRTELIECLALLEPDFEDATSRPLSGDWARAAALAGVTSGADEWLPRLTRLRERLNEGVGGSFALRHAHLAPAIDALLPKLSTLVGAAGAIPSSGRITAFTRRIRDIFTSMTTESLDRYLILTALDDLDGLSEIAGDMSVGRFAELLRTTLSDTGTREERFGRGGPGVLSLMTSRGLRYPIVVIPGLVEKLFPMGRRQDPILLDSERQRINDAVFSRPEGRGRIERLAVRSETISEERLLFRLAVASARETLVLSFPRLDPATARPKIASIFLLRVVEQLSGDTQDYESFETSEHVRRVALARRFPDTTADAVTIDEYDGCSILAAVAAGRPQDVAHLAAGNAPLHRALIMEESRWGSAFHTEYDGVLASDEAIEAARSLSGFTRGGPADGATVSATALEEYASCPFKFLLKRVLWIEEIEEPEDALELNPLERGTLFHDVLERFLRDARDEGALPLRPDARDRLLALADRIARSDRWSVSAHAGAQELVRGELAASLRLWLRYELQSGEGYRPSYFEARFGGRSRGNEDTALTLDEGVPFQAAGDVAIRFSGKIDRIDIADDGRSAKVIDYKTGQYHSLGKGGDKLLANGTRLQLPIYLMAAEAMLAREHPTTEVVSAEYLHVTEPNGPKAAMVTAEELEERRDDLAMAVGIIVQGIAAGQFFPFPDERGCKNCDFRDACPSVMLPLAEMKNGDRKTKGFTEGLAGIE